MFGRSVQVIWPEVLNFGPMAAILCSTTVRVLKRLQRLNVLIQGSDEDGKHVQEPPVASIADVLNTHTNIVVQPQIVTRRVDSGVPRAKLGHCDAQAPRN